MPTLKTYPPVKIDRAHQLAAVNASYLRDAGTGLSVYSPSQHVADAFNSCTGQGVAGLSIMALIWQPKRFWRLPPVRETQGKPKIAVVAHDLRYDGKTNQ